MRMLVLVAQSEWLPASAPKGVSAMAASDAVEQVRAAASAGAHSVLLLERGLTESGQCLVLSDHINLTGENPLVGPNAEAFGVRFPDMTEPYPLRTRLAAVGDEGVAVDIPTEPSREDLAAVKALGAQAVTSGLAAAVIAANHAGLNVGAVVIPPMVDGGLVLEKALGLLAG